MDRIDEVIAEVINEYKQLFSGGLSEADERLIAAAIRSSQMKFKYPKPASVKPTEEY